MKKIKQFWKELKYWQKGATIGLLIGIIYIIYLFSTLLLITHKEIFAPLNDLILYFPREIGDIAFECWFCNSLLAFISILSIIQFTLFGALIGLIMGKIKKK
ncbi:hypothetical protein HYX08_03805 [Candidatus Woesearchaeota archaeon]|nr:hypothetical protein [Candidatus Woesearchaeota archaeon]